MGSIFVMYKNEKFHEIFFNMKKVKGALEAKKFVKEDLTQYEVYELNLGKVDQKELKKLMKKRDI